MTPQQFIRKWKPVALTERATAQSHFIDLCALVGHDDPVAADPTGESFTFEKGVTKTGGGDGFADVWKRGFFAWEYKKKKRNLDDALAQLVRYAAALENPPLQVACDTDRFLIRTAWTNAVPKQYEFALDDLVDPEESRYPAFGLLRSGKASAEGDARRSHEGGGRQIFHHRLSPARARRTRGHRAFRQPAGVLFLRAQRETIAERLLSAPAPARVESPENATRYFDGLFAAMEKGGDFDLTRIAYFNGGLFDGRRALPLDSGDIGLLIAAGSLDWSQIDPTIFGTLFERFLDPEKRGQIGAHYTDPDKIMMIVEPVILRPLRAEWDTAHAEIAALLEGRQKPPIRSKTKRRHESAPGRRGGALALSGAAAHATVLDPACGSGNFLYLALQGVKDLELKANLECEALGLDPRTPAVGPEIVHGIEINPLAAELARTTIWIGDIQWGIRNGIYARPEPILRPLDAIKNRDALLSHSAASDCRNGIQSQKSSKLSRPNGRQQNLSSAIRRFLAES